MDAKAQAVSEVNEVRLSDLAHLAWQRKWLIICGTLAFGILGAALTMVVPKKYSASIIVDPVSNSPELSQAGGLGAIASEFGGLASLAGLRLPQESSKRAETLAVLESQALTEKYIASNNLLPTLYRGRWDASAGRWRSKRDTPTLWKANRYFKSKIREVSVDPKTGLVTMTITWTNASLAAQWANGLVKMTNDYLRQKAIAESERNIAYLTEQAAKTDALGVRQEIYDLMQSEISKAMLARGNEEYALRVIDPAQAPESPSSPKPVLWTIASLFVGAFLTFLLALLKAEAPARRTSPRPAIDAT